MNLQAGQILADKYRIVRQIGQGGMGAVYEGENTRIHRRVAIKTLHSAVAGKADVLQRFEREAQAAGRIGSEHIVEVLDLGDLPDGSRFMVMEFLEGTTLSERIVKQGRIAPRDLVPILTQILEGLRAAHEAGIIHRDLKPANVFLIKNRPQRPDFVKILDFGVSKFNVLNSEEMSMTRTGAVMGTPYYMSPEQAKGARAIDLRSDLYSIGVIIYEAITGQVPFNAETFNELIFKIALESPPPPEQFAPNLDPAFGMLMRKAMAREPTERFQTAADLREAVLAWARDFDARAAAGPQPLPSQHQHQAAGTVGRTQMLPMVGAMQSGAARGSQPSVPVLPGPPAPPLGLGAGNTQLVHAEQAATVAMPARKPRKKSIAPIAIALFVVVLGVGGLAAAIYGRSRVAQAGPKDTSSTTKSASTTTAPSATATVASATATTTAPTNEPLTLSASETVSAEEAPAVASASSTAKTTPVAQHVPPRMLPPPQRPAAAPPPPVAPPPPKPGGRDIRPES